MRSPFERAFFGTALGALLVAVSLPSAFGWSMGGHRVTGVMAAREIAATAPRVGATVASIMQAHPAAIAFGARVNEAGDDPLARLERLFTEMAQWPDEVRSGPYKNFHRGEWHTIDIPFVAPGFKRPLEPQFPIENMLSALQENTRLAADSSLPAADRAVALCWIFHLVGDMHQPLHAASLYSAAFPDGDRYGTRFWVMPPGGKEVVSLHYFWDSAIQRSQNLAEVEKTADHLRGTYPQGSLEEMQRRPYRGAESFERWTREESHPLAIDAAYLGGRLAGTSDKINARHLGDEYAANVRTIAARRMALSGYRLAEVLRAIFPK